MTYQYDQLNRLMRAETAKTPTKGSAPALRVTFDPQTNRLYGPSYDGNGNAGGTFDIKNRLFSEPVGYGFSISYDPWDKRIFRRECRGQTACYP